MARPGKFTEAAQYYAVHGLIGALGALPRPLAIKAGRGIGALAYYLAGGLARTGRRNLAFAFPEKSDAERDALLRESFQMLGRTLGEFSLFPKATPDDLRGLIKFDDENLAQYRAIENSGRGIIFLTGHIGSWEVLSFAWSALERPLSFLARPIDNPRIEDLTQRIRSRYGNEVINKKNAARAAMRVLRDGGMLGILADLNTQPREGVFVPFFSKLACTTSGVAKLALATDAYIFPVCAVWDAARGQYYFYGAEPFEVERTGDMERDIETVTARFTAALETLIRRYPAQWLWIHNRWKTRPLDERLDVGD